MRNVLVWLLRLPFIVISILVLVGISEEHNPMDIFFSIGGVSLCVGVCILAGILNKPLSSSNEKVILFRFRVFIMIGAIGIFIGKYIY